MAISNNGIVLTCEAEVRRYNTAIFMRQFVNERFQIYFYEEKAHMQCFSLILLVSLPFENSGTYVYH